MSESSPIMRVLRQGHKQVEREVDTAIRHYQRELRMWMVDHGIEIPDFPTPDKPNGPNALHTKMRKVVSTAQAEWERVVVEPPNQGWERIDHYIRSAEGSGWSWLKPYTRDGQTAWCGHFASFCWRAAGVKHDVVYSATPSTYRLSRWAKGTARVVDLDNIRPGDLVVVGPTVDSPYGAHITIATAKAKNGFIETIEGNAKGNAGNGAWAEGVVTQKRPFSATSNSTYIIRFAYRPLKEDFDE